MNPTVAKILSRFDGDVEAAIEYCRQMSVRYEGLRDEYLEYKRRLIELADGKSLIAQ